MSNYKHGERILVSDYPDSDWTSRIFDEYASNDKVMCVNDVHEIRFGNGGDYSTSKWNYHKKIEKQKKAPYAPGEIILVEEDGKWIEKSFYEMTPDNSGDIWYVSGISRSRNHKSNKEDIVSKVDVSQTDTAKYIKTIVKSMVRDDIQISIDTAGALIKLFYQVADEKDVDSILKKYKPND